jgi:hypothetical protein
MGVQALIEGLILIFTIDSNRRLATAQKLKHKCLIDVVSAGLQLPPFSCPSTLG